MTASTLSLIFELCTSIEQKIADIKHDLCDIGESLTRIELGTGKLASAIAGSQLRIERLETTLGRIERKMDLLDG